MQTCEFESGVERKAGSVGDICIFQEYEDVFKMCGKKRCMLIGERLCVGRRDQRIEDPDLRFVFAGSIREDDGVAFGNWRVWREGGGEEAVSGKCVVGSEHSTIYGVTIWKMFVETWD